MRSTNYETHEVYDLPFLKDLQREFSFLAREARARAVDKRYSAQEKTQLMEIFAKFGWRKRPAEVKLICHALVDT